MPSSTSRIEQIIYEMEEFVDSCKESFLNKSMIMVDREKFEDLIRDLKASTPEEIKRYQKIIANKEAILEDARNKADALMKDATARSEQLLSENEIMMEAYSKADGILKDAQIQAQTMVENASMQAQSILENAEAQAQSKVDNATLEANAAREGAANYMDDVLAHLENIISASSKEAMANYNTLIGGLQRYGEIIASNRKELHPDEEMVVSDQAVGAGDVNDEE